MTNAKQMTFVLRNQETVSLLVSKDDAKLRFQANSASALQLILTETYTRLTSPAYSLEISSACKIPSMDLMEAIDRHFAHRLEVKALKKTLEDRTYQMRTIQKKLLSRFKDKNPSALNNLDFLLQHTYSQVIETASQIETVKQSQENVSVALSNAVTCNNLIVRTLCGMSQEQFDLLTQFVTPHVDCDAGDVGWEELTLASTAHLLRTCLSRKEQTNASNAPPSQMEPIENTDKLKRQILAVYERVKNGGILTL